MNNESDKEILSSLAVMAEEIQDQTSDQESSMASLETQVINLDTEDALRLENMLLKQQVASMSAKLAQVQIKENQETFQNHIVDKLNVDVSKFQLQVNPTNNTVVLVPR